MRNGLDENHFLIAGSATGQQDTYAGFADDSDVFSRLVNPFDGVNCVR